MGGPETVTKAQDGQEYHTKSHWDDNRLVTDWSVQQGRQLVRSGRIIRYLSKEDELVEDSTLNVQGAVHETQEVFIRVADEPADVTASEPSVFILSDTKGTDFGPYLAAMTASVRQKWFARMPISAKLGAQARVTAQFSILNDGSIEDLRLIDTTGSSPALDHAALDSIEESSPFSPLPAGFSGSKLSLWFIFRYNLDKVGGH